MAETNLLSNSLHSKSLFFVRAAWISAAAIIFWALISYFIIEPQHISLIHLIIWGQLMLISLILFIVGFIISVIDLYRFYHTTDVVLKRKLFRRMLWSLPGLFMAIVLLFLVGYLIFAVLQSIVAVG